MLVKLNKQTKEFQVVETFKLGAPTIRRTVDKRGNRPDSFFINLAPGNKYIDIEIPELDALAIAKKAIEDEFSAEVARGDIDIDDLESASLTCKITFGIKAGAMRTSREIDAEKFAEFLGLDK